MIDSHTHLDSTPGTDAEIVAAARAAGVTRILTIGTDAESSRKAQAAAEAHEDVWFAVGHHPNNATGYTAAHTDEQVERLQQRIRDMEASRSWKVTAPLRRATGRIRPNR